MLRDAHVADLVESACAAGTDAARWPVFLARLQHALDARIVGLFAQDMRTQNGAFSFSIGLAPDQPRAYRDYYAERNVWMIHGNDLNLPGNVRTSEERYPIEALRRTEFYSGFLRPNGVKHGVGGTILRDGSLAVNLTVLRRNAPFGRDAVRLLSALMPHLRRAVRTYRRLANTRLEEHAVLAALDRLPCGVLLVDADARQVFVNVEGRRIVAARDGVWLDRGVLTAARPADTKTLRGLVARAAMPGGGGGEMALGRPSSRRALGVEVMPLALPAGESPSSRVVAVFLVDPDRTPESDVRLLSRLYALTPAEAGLAARLVAGDTLQEAAEQRHIARETARTHLKRILRKTGARRQAELVLRFGQGPMGLAAGDGGSFRTPPRA